MKRTNGQTDEIDGRENERLTKLMDWRTNETDGMTKLWTGEAANRLELTKLVTWRRSETNGMTE
jgi:hypothetical protein